MKSEDKHYYGGEGGSIYEADEGDVHANILRSEDENPLSVSLVGKSKSSVFCEEEVRKPKL